MRIKEEYGKLLRENSSQGFVECLAALLFFDLCLYLHYGSGVCLALNFLSLPLIFIHLYESLSKGSSMQQALAAINKSYWALLIPFLAVIGVLKFDILLYVVFNVVIYFQMVKGVTHVFTVGEHYINAHILASLLYFSCHSFSIESTVVYYPVRVCIRDRCRCLGYSGCFTGWCIGCWRWIGQTFL
eukprot:TRINITY_DN2171_c0_g1_i15.p1 TRINITY_DN2171_c0_g1~~TRINITY_DN2171_c0_g1_i15.p1  ORF type:complete len:186 (-),score=24.76 TRINITY_DN2171_c0_g1_i15:689-1246(-)